MRNPMNAQDPAVKKLADARIELHATQVKAKKLRKRVDLLETRLESLLRSRPSNPTCAAFNHAARDHHEAFPCPCVDRWHRAADLACEALKQEIDA